MIQDKLFIGNLRARSLTLEASAVRVGTTGTLDVLRIRQDCRLSRLGLALLLGVNVSTLRSWEQGQGKPSGAARILLRLFEKDPLAVWDATQLESPQAGGLTVPSRAGELEQQTETATSATIEDQIEQLYEKIISMNENAAPAAEIDRAYARLLELQTAEAAKFREQFEASLEMPIDAGAQILTRARALREELESLTAPDLPTALADDPQAPPAAG